MQHPCMRKYEIGLKVVNDIYMDGASHLGAECRLKGPMLVSWLHSKIHNVELTSFFLFLFAFSIKPLFSPRTSTQMERTYIISHFFFFFFNAGINKLKPGTAQSLVLLCVVLYTSFEFTNMSRLLCADQESPLSRMPGCFNTVFILQSIDNEQCGSCPLSTSSCACPSESSVTIETLHLFYKLVFNLLNPSIRIRKLSQNIADWQAHNVAIFSKPFPTIT